MNDNRSILRIIGMTATFIVFAAIGYFIPFEKMLQKGGSQPVEIAAAGGGGGGAVAVNPAVPQTPADQTTTPVSPAGQDAAQQPTPQPTPQQQPAVTDPSAAPAQQAAPAQVVDPNNVPVIETAWVAPRSKKKVQLGYPVSIKAAAPSGDALVYELWLVGGARPAYTSTNGYFAEVDPVSGGTYELQVKNSRTGDVVKQELKGFYKVQKMSASKLQEQLNADVQEDLFYFMFDMDKLQISYSGIDSSEYPANLNALLTDRAAFGWRYEVVGTPKYDKYNRIVSFKLNVTYL